MGSHWGNKPLLKVGLCPAVNGQHKTNSIASLKVLCLKMHNVESGFLFCFFSSLDHTGLLCVYYGFLCCASMELLCM